MILEGVESKLNKEQQPGNLIQFQPVINFLKNKKCRDQNSERKETISIFNTPRCLSPMNTLNTQKSSNKSLNSINTEDSPHSNRKSEFTLAKTNKNLNFQNFPKFTSNTAFSFENINPVKHITCSCKNSQCLKLYCECFSLGAYCDPAVCSCKGCSNNSLNENLRKDKIEAYTKRNPNAFKKIKNVNFKTVNLNSEIEKGCTCKKSNCQKKYCECFQNGLKCGVHCKCADCKNCLEEDKILEGKDTSSKATTRTSSFSFTVNSVTKTVPCMIIINNYNINENFIINQVSQVSKVMVNENESKDEEI